ncbi:UPF0415 protein C7orf25-like [Mizuhopecten yessoensis]|uniref:UPF0415 protein C7orf25-like n=1 Tax=Mizuhopecten yessoensis TaxID=6573 RepID=A0A210PHB7_MIZYE|nr:UPF0415 protein C7orf25-like [Mizuhopecten yessoensis]
MASRIGEEESCDQLLLTYLQEANTLIQKCQQYQHIKGMQKLEKKCRAELKYLQSLRKKTDFIHESQLKSSNLCHFAGILHAMQVIPGVVSMMTAVHSPNRTSSLHVDIVAGQGQVWVKVIARKAQALHLIWAGKELYACQTAWDDFETILKTLGGPEEKRRAQLLLHRVKVIPDQPSKRAKDLPDTGKIRQRTKVIFGTGDELGAVTTTANMGFVRAAEHQGVSFAIYSHSSRALTEDKEKNATPLDDLSASSSERKF